MSPLQIMRVILFHELHNSMITSCITVYFSTEYTLVESNPMPPPAPAIHPEDSRSTPPSPACGRLGRYRGSPSARMRQRMRDMVRIIGGRPAPPGKWPWQVAVLNRYKVNMCFFLLLHLRSKHFKNGKP